MADVKLTKNELRIQQKKLQSFEKYLPTLQLKKAMLQAEVFEARLEIAARGQEMRAAYEAIMEYSPLLSTTVSIKLEDALKVLSIKRRYENIAGVEVPYFESISFEEISYSLFDSPPWIDAALLGFKSFMAFKAKVLVAGEKKQALEEELRQVSIRVNLFEKILIPRALANIKKIRVFLGDQELAAVSRAKAAKNKIEERN